MPATATEHFSNSALAAGSNAVSIPFVRRPFASLFQRRRHGHLHRTKEGHMLRSILGRDGMATLVITLILGLLLFI